MFLDQGQLCVVEVLSHIGDNTGNDWLWRIEDGMDPYESAVICFTEMGTRCHGQPDFQEFVETQIAPRVLEQMRQHHPKMKGT